MCKSVSSLCLLLALLFVSFEGTAAKESVSFITDTRIPFDCPKGTPPSVCFKRWTMFPFPRVGRDGQARQQRSFGLVKYPRVGISDPQLLLDKDDESWPGANLDFTNDAYSPRVSEGRNRRDGAWAFFLITPNFREQPAAAAVDSQFGADDVAME
ncbi:uncharacterized protein LOC107980830 isoform X2 [Nasonia vitripennis]|uniref:Uncharacterized protein n=1 Tax=Nasonia vitripennis TaxID=7425 RepID=A0A7M7IWP6_NASVI|nr:uncharacterized protein LOC107980830 isoform X2 [Nasonia vitripennis]